MKRSMTPLHSGSPTYEGVMGHPEPLHLVDPRIVRVAGPRDRGGHSEPDGVRPPLSRPLGILETAERSHRDARARKESAMRGNQGDKMTRQSSWSALEARRSLSEDQ